jgi:hypothetical protein
VPTVSENIMALKPTILENEPTLRLLAGFGEVESAGPSTREIEKLPLSVTARFSSPSRKPENGTRPPNDPVSPKLAKSRMA